MDLSIQRNEAAQRFETTVDGVLCVLDYRLRDGVLSIDHVGVPQPVGGRGIAAALTKTALDTARSRNWRVVPHCAYAATWIERHPQYRDLVNPA